MPKLIPSKMIKIPRLMEVGEYRDRRFAGDKPSLQQLKKWIQDGTIAGEQKGNMYFVDLQSELLSSHDPLLAKLLEI
jgi:hypothetical protein